MSDERKPGSVATLGHGRASRGSAVDQQGTSTFGGVSVDRFCDRCREGLRSARAEGKSGAEFCLQCASLTAWIRPPDGGSAHNPLPWHWAVRVEESTGTATSATLRDGRGVPILHSMGDQLLGRCPAATMELIRLAPELEAAMRYLVGMAEGSSPTDPKVAEARELLTALDVARKAPG